ncbi:MAG TPA: hypothetical protein VK625_04265, partial [Flavitalea sp.]|nr:hypothetical protein [Flavitalea sp.]
LLLTDGNKEGLLKTDSGDIRVISFLHNVKPAGDQRIQFTAPEEDVSVLVKTSGSPKIKLAEQNSEKVEIQMNSGSGYVLITFSDDQKKLSALAHPDFKKRKQAVDEYYSGMLKSSFIQTPDTNMNAAFRSAIYNLEYTWLEPIGWLECLHNWFGLWHMQASAGADWIGQTYRTRASILEHAFNLIDADSAVALPGGLVKVKPFHSEKERENLKKASVPQFLPNKAIHHEYGGSNQYWISQIRHYIKISGDKKIAVQLIPYVDKVIAEILNEHDKDGNLLIGWGLQIGNQEDFIANPNDGTVPSIELINIFRTRAELAALAGNQKEANNWNERSDQVMHTLYEKLWMKDLGRFAFFRDPLGNLRLDGQYQTFLYPAIYDIVDPLDQYTGLRHLQDRLLGLKGSVFNSNNFSWHANGTWGMQNAENAQPWASWGFSKSGLNNMTWRPLKAMADWTMDINHRGAWPEMGEEPTPGYFTPPAGLYIASTVEALYGLKIDAARNTLEIAPSFPDHWEAASINIPHLKAGYQRKENTVIYSVETDRPLIKMVRWSLPAAKILQCQVNGRNIPYKIIPAVGHMILLIDSIYEKKAVFSISYSQRNYELFHAGSVAEGDNFIVRASGIKIDGIVDRTSTLRSITYNDSAIYSTVHNGLLKPYEKYGRLGQLNFSRRTFFIHARLPDSSKLWLPVDFTVLPRIEASFAGEIVKRDSVYYASLNIRNNTCCIVKQSASLQFGEKNVRFDLNINPRSEITASLPVPLDIIKDLSPGDNAITLSIPENGSVSLKLVASSILKDMELKATVQIPLPESDLYPDSLWHKLRIMAGFPHIFFTFSDYGWPQPMAALKDSSITVSEIPGLRFSVPRRSFVPVSHKSGKSSFKLELPSGAYKKLYLLVIPFVDNHDVFSVAGRVSVYAQDKIVYNRELCYPGDIDYWVPNVNKYTFATYRAPREGRFGLLPILTPGQSDWFIGKPPEFPQDKYWSSSLAVESRSCLMNVIEINLAKATHSDYLIFESVGAYPAFGIVAAAGQISTPNE